MKQLGDVYNIYIYIHNLYIYIHSIKCSPRILSIINGMCEKKHVTTALFVVVFFQVPKNLSIPESIRTFQGETPTELKLAYTNDPSNGPLGIFVVVKNDMNS